MLDLINEAETDKDKNKRHSMDLDLKRHSQIKRA